jgi:hypothetical protein
MLNVRPSFWHLMQRTEHLGLQILSPSVVGALAPCMSSPGPLVGPHGDPLFASPGSTTLVLDNAVT